MWLNSMVLKWRYADYGFLENLEAPCRRRSCGRRGTSPRSGLGLHRHMNDAAPGVCALRVSYE